MQLPRGMSRGIVRLPAIAKNDPLAFAVLGIRSHPDTS